MKCSKRSFAVSVLFALLLLFGTATLNARDSDFESLIFATAQTANHQCLSCAISRLPVLEANTICRVSGHLPGLHPLHLWYRSSWFVLARVSEVIEQGLFPLLAFFGSGRSDE